MAAEKFIDYYAVLELPISASKKEIIARYNNIQVKDDAIKIAYETLTDEEKRKSYDTIYAQKYLVKSSKTDEKEEQALIGETQTNFDVLDELVKVHLGQNNLDISSREQVADEAEQLYRQNMWPLLEKVKKLSGEKSSAYLFICKLHAKTLFSLGELCMWANRFKRAIGMYNTALALAGDDQELIYNCNQALEIARIAYETAKVQRGMPKTKIQPEKNKDKTYISYTQMLLWIFVGFIIASVCFWVALFILDKIF